MSNSGTVGYFYSATHGRHTSTALTAPGLTLNIGYGDNDPVKPPNLRELVTTSGSTALAQLDYAGINVIGRIGQMTASVSTTWSSTFAYDAADQLTVSVQPSALGGKFHNRHRFRSHIYEQNDADFESGRGWEGSDAREKQEAVLEEYERSGMTGMQFARHVGVKYPTLMNWVQRRKRDRGKGVGETSERGQWIEAVVEGSDGGGGGKRIADCGRRKADCGRRGQDIGKCELCSGR